MHGGSKAYFRTGKASGTQARPEGHKQCAYGNDSAKASGANVLCPCFAAVLALAKPVAPNSGK